MFLSKAQVLSRFGTADCPICGLESSIAMFRARTFERSRTHTPTLTCEYDAADMSSIPTASNSERMEKMIRIMLPSAPIILRLPHLAFPLRAARIERRDSRTNLA
jgi:hypothetical protein